MNMTEQQIHEEYYLLGVKYAMSKLSKDNKTKSKVIKKSIGRSLVGAGQKTLKVPEIANKLTGRFATGGQKFIGKVLKDKVNPVRMLSNISDSVDLATTEGRKRLKDKYSLITKEDDSPDNMVSDIISLAIPTNPIDQVSAGSRMMDRARKGAYKIEKQRVDAAKEMDKELRAGNKEKADIKKQEIQLATDSQPRFRGY